MTHATPWTASYPPTLRWDSEIPLRPVDQILDDAVARWPDQVAIDFMGRRFSYAELAQLVARAAKGLQALGVGPGVPDGIALLVVHEVGERVPLWHLPDVLQAMRGTETVELG